MISLFAIFANRLGVNPKEAERFIKFLMVGTLGFIIDFGTLTFLIEVVNLPGQVEQNTPFPSFVGLALANSISFTLAVLSNFTFNRYWTYPESRSKKKRVQLPQFGLVSVLGLIINTAIFVLATPIFNNIIGSIDVLAGSIAGYIPAKILATMVVLFWNFFVNRFWTFDNVERG
jgi:putative flippase GtrA